MSKVNRNLKRALIGIGLFLLGLWPAYHFWLNGDGRDSTSIISVFFLLLSSAGLFLFGFSVETIRNFSYSGMVGIVVIFFLGDYLNSAAKSGREQHLHENGKTLYTKVSKIEYVNRGKYRSWEMRYEYTVDGSTYKKYDNDEGFIRKTKIQVGDSLLIRYWTENPHQHSYFRY